MIDKIKKGINKILNQSLEIQLVYVIVLLMIINGIIWSMYIVRRTDDYEVKVEIEEEIEEDEDDEFAGKKEVKQEQEESEEEPEEEVKEDKSVSEIFTEYYNGNVLEKYGLFTTNKIYNVVYYLNNDQRIGQKLDTEGVVDYRILDFDGDGQEELFVMRISNSKETDMVFQIYEFEDEKVQLADELTIEYGAIGNYTNDEEIRYYLKQSQGKYYLCQSYKLLTVIEADGATYCMAIYDYDGSFDLCAKKSISGSSLEYDTEHMPMIDELRKLGFDHTADNLSYSLEFDKEDGLDELFISRSVCLISDEQSSKFYQDFDLSKLPLNRCGIFKSQSEYDSHLQEIEEMLKSVGKFSNEFWHEKVAHVDERYLFEAFLNREISATIYGEYVYYDEYESEYDIERTDFIDADNDGVEELVLYTYNFYGMQILDIENGDFVVLSEGEGTTGYLSIAIIEGEKWLCHRDTSHQGRQMYNFKKYNGYGNIVDEFDISAEYWNNVNDRYDENSVFTYRGKTITMQEYESLINKFTANMYQ